MSAAAVVPLSADATDASVAPAQSKANIDELVSGGVMHGG